MYWAICVLIKKQAYVGDKIQYLEIEIMKSAKNS